MGSKPCAMDTREIINLLADIACQVESLIGEKGAISVFRYAGKQLGKRLGEGHKGTEEDACALIAKFFHDKAFMEAITLDGSAVATLSGCKIGLVLKERGIEAGKPLLCHFGLGSLHKGTIPCALTC